VPAAGFDPAYVPGITPPPVKAVEADGDGEAAREPEIAVPVVVEEDGALLVVDPEALAEVEPEPEAEAEADPEAAGEAEESGGPALEASDRRGAILAGRKGVVFRLDGEEADFRWTEIKAVEVDTPRFGKRFGVTVYVSARRWFENDVEAPNRRTLKRWAEELDAVLDAYFDDGEEEAEADAAAEATADADSVDADKAGAESDADADTDKAGADDKAADADDQAADAGDQGADDADAEAGASA
jgi:hypothetical protein